ncbi:MAG: carboxypeptidase regulatory-like domain-containing protein, partial [Bacteroidales bacterium]|nr:carboxypeptidase regulatory-like domain-containing protein [Bacteroidales bacterium]
MLMLFTFSASIMFGQVDTKPVKERDGTEYLLKGKAPAYVPSDNKAIIFSEGFEGTWPPSGWTLNPATGGFVRSNAGWGHTGTYAAWHGWLGTFNSWMISPVMNFTAAPAYELRFWQMDNDAPWYCFHEVAVTTNGGGSWTQVYTGPATEDYYSEIVLDLSAFAGNSSVQIGFHYSGSWCDDWWIDDITVESLFPGDLYGYVFNGAGITIAGATVGVEALGLSTTSWPDGHYRLHGVYSGPQVAYGTKAGYNTIYHNVNVPIGGEYEQDFILTAPTMIISPTFHTYTLNPEEYFITQTGILNTGDGPLTWSATVVYPVTDDGQSLSSIVSVNEPGEQQAGSIIDQKFPSNSSLEGEGGSGGSNTDAFNPCPPESIFANEPCPTSGSWAGRTSAEDPGYKVFQSFSGLTENIGSAIFWGLSLQCCWSACNEDPKEFLVEFWEAGGTPGASVATYTIEAYRVATGEVALGFPIFEWTVAFPGVDLSDGWISIQETNTGTPSCWFLWWNSAPGGTGTALQHDGGSYTTMSNPQSLCLGAGGGSGSWLTLDYYDNIVPPMGGLDNVPTNFDAQGTVAGEVYTADLVFTSSDPYVGTITIPCTMIIAGDPLVPPTDLTVELIDDIVGTVELNWVWATDLTFQFFIVRRDGVPVGTSPITTYTEDLPDYGTYCYTVQSFYDEGTSVPSDEVCIDWDWPEIFVDPDFHEAWVWVDGTHQWVTTISNVGIGTLQYVFPDYVTDAFNCDHSIVMYDDYGDGWNGGTVTVYVNGSIVLNSITMSGAGPVTQIFDATHGDEIYTTFSCGLWCYECSYEILDGLGNIIATDGMGGVNPTGIPPGTTYAACPVPSYIVDVIPATGIIPQGGSQDVTIYWDAAGFGPGDYYEDLKCTSNDPVDSVVYIGNLMHVYTPAQFAGSVTDCE